MHSRFLAAALAALALLPALPGAAQTAPVALQASARQDGDQATGQIARAQPIPEATAPQPGAGWPAEIFAASDLPPDPTYRLGTLANSMRYIIRPNATPPAQGMVQLWIDFGSISEEDGQRGWAHFIEHMAFNGSTNLPEGEMVRLLEREGLAFGADTNASTSFDTTRYTLDLPRNDPALLDTALMLMRETVSELTFREEAVERERGVILSEKRVRDTYQLRALVDGLGFHYPGSRLAERLPIGTTEAINRATGASMRELWRRFYRPERVALIVVGDYDPDEVEAMIQRRFGDWNRAAEAGPAPDQARFGPFDFDSAGPTSIFLDPALSEQIVIARTGPWLGGPDTSASRRARLERQIGYDIINRRLQRLSRLDDPPFRGAALATSDVAQEARTTQLAVFAADGEWERALAAAQQEYRRALENGFTAAEVAEQIANYRSAIEANAAGASTRPNSSFVTGAITLLRDQQVPTTPQSGLERFEAHAPLITPETVLAALKAELVPLDNPLIRFEGRLPPEGGQDALRQAWARGMAGALLAREDDALAQFAYTSFGEPGAVVADETDERLQIRKIRFANGLRLNLRPTPLQRDRILVELHVDGGDLLNTRANPLATAMAGSLPLGGLGQHTFDELQSILAGRRVELDVTSASETFRLAATTSPADLELQLQLLAAGLADPAFRPAAEAQYRRNVDAYFASLRATPASAFSAEIGGIVSDQDPRFTLQPAEAYRALSFARLREDIQDRWANGALELGLIGDFDPEAAIRLVGATLGALPPREDAFQRHAENRQRSFTADRSPRQILHEGPADQAMLAMIWPTRDDRDQRESLVLNLLERVMRIALTDSLREELGQAYSPRASAIQSGVHPGYGTFEISAALALADIDAARAAMLATVANLGQRAVNEDLLLRARQPALEAFENTLSTNQGWMSIAGRAQGRPRRIERYLTGRDMLASITAEEIRAAAQRYLVPEHRLEVVVVPRDGGHAPATGGQDGASDPAPDAAPATPAS